MNKNFLINYFKFLENQDYIKLEKIIFLKVYSNKKKLKGE